MPIFTDKNNEKRAINYVVIIIFILILFFMYQVGCNKGRLKVGDIELTGQQVEEVKEVLSETVTDFRRQTEVISKISQKELPTILKDSIATLNYIREKEINQGEELLNKLERFNDLSYDDQVSLMENVLNYLSKKSHPDRYKDYSEIAKNIVATNKTEGIISDNKYKDEEINKLKTKIALLSKEKRTVELRLAETERKIQEKERIIETLLKEDSLKNATYIATLNSEINSLQGEIKKLKNEMEGYTPIRIKNCSFSSPGCRSKKDASYIVGCMKTLEVSFVVNYNNPSATGKSENVKIIFNLPTNDPSRTIVKERNINAKIGEETKVVFDDENYKFVSGLYSVQIIHDKYSPTIPVELKKLTAKKGLGN